MLSISDFLVCTFSSQVNHKNARFLKLIIKLNVMAQVCRIAYELMQQHHVDASDRFKSLDDIWWVLLLPWTIITMLVCANWATICFVQVLRWSGWAPTRGSAKTWGGGKKWWGRFLICGKQTFLKVFHLILQPSFEPLAYVIAFSDIPWGRGCVRGCRQPLEWV